MMLYNGDTNIKRHGAKRTSIALISKTGNGNRNNCRRVFIISLCFSGPRAEWFKKPEKIID
jgi:hypothetical protein